MADALFFLKPFGIDVFCIHKKFLVFNMVSRNMKIKYRRSVLGVLWTLLVPLGTALVYYFVFKSVFKVQLPNHLVFILSGVLPWSFFSQTFLEGSDSLVGNSGLLTKVPIPIQVFPFVGSLTNLITLVFAFPVIIGAALIGDVGIHAGWVAVPVLILMLFVQAYGFSVIFGMMYVYFRDLKHILGILTQVWFYTTPVLYDVSMVPENLRFIIYCNPVGYLFDGLHRVIAMGEPLPLKHLWISGGWTVGLLGVTLFTLKNTGKNLIEKI